jgi:hypothetical protein
VLKSCSGKKIAFSTNGAGSTLGYHVEECELILFISCTKFKSKWIKALHIKPEILKSIEENVGKSLKVMNTGEKFLNRTAIACAIRASIDKWDLIKLQNFCKAKDTVNKAKW